jgi:hypothetical protein
LEDIHRKLRDLDPSLYREAMSDLQYEGAEPLWAKYDFLERIRMLGADGKMDPMDESDPHVLKREIDRLVNEKCRLATELEKTQEQLRIQVNVDKDSTTRAQLEIQQIQGQIKHDTA